MRTRVLIPAVVMLVLLVASGVLADATGGAASSDGLKPGDVLDQRSWQRAEGLLPSEILKHYEHNEYVNPISDWPANVYNWPEDFLAGSKQNAGRYTTGKLGEILESASGKQPAYIIGFPFPDIAPADPAAGTKILWNFYYRTYYFGNLRAESQLNMMSPGSLERRLDVDVRFMYYDGVPEQKRVKGNPQNFLYQQLVVDNSPNDLQGTGSLSWRYRDPQKRDSSWAYVPALRRVRAVSPANRSDGFLGSDMSQDDGPFFDGKPEDFEWHLKGEAEGLRFAEDLNLKDVSKARWVPEVGAWDADWPDTKFLGYMDPAWKGLAWAPTGPSVLARRPFWVVEGVPRDRYYLYGKLELWIDKLTYQGAWHRKYGWKGEQLNTMQVMAWNPIPFTRPNGKVDYMQGSNMAYQCAENLKLNRATVAGIKSSPTSHFYGRIKFNPDVFDVDALARSGK